MKGGIFARFVSLLDVVQGGVILFGISLAFLQLEWRSLGYFVCLRFLIYVAFIIRHGT